MTYTETILKILGNRSMTPSEIFAASKGHKNIVHLRVTLNHMRYDGLISVIEKRKCPNCFKLHKAYKITAKGKTKTIAA